MENLPERIQGPYQGGFLWQDELVFGQCDLALNVRISTLIEHLVTASSQHCRSFGMTYASFLANDVAFVLTRCTLNIHKLPVCFQHITLHTWIDGLKGPYYQRVTQWRDENDELLVSGRSDWVLIQPSTRNLCKPDKNDQRFTVKSPVILPPCQRVKLGDTALENLGSHKVSWSDIDGNGHLHCANYGDIIWNALPSSLQQKKPQRFSMEFQKEGCLNDHLEIFGGENGSAYFVTGNCEGNASFKSCIEFCDD